MMYANSSMFSVSRKSLTHWSICLKWLKVDFHHISRPGGFITLVEVLSRLGSGVGFTMSAGSGVGVVSNDG